MMVRSWNLKFADMELACVTLVVFERVASNAIISLTLMRLIT